jgi:tetratricopeptide (TPR) repeat protein
LLTEALSLAAARRDSALYSRAAMWLGNALLNLGRHDDARALIERALPTAVRIEDREREGFMRLGLAYLDLTQGHLTAARRGYEQALDRLRQSGNRFGELDALTGLGRVYDQLGEVDRARRVTATAGIAEPLAAPEALPAALGFTGLSTPDGAAAFELALPAQAEVEVSLYDIAGRQVARLHEGQLAPGWHRLAVPLGRLARGVYFGRSEIASGGARESRTARIVLTK